MVGGGLAGLSTAFHLVRSGVKHLTIFDTEKPGEAKASSVAGKDQICPLVPSVFSFVWELCAMLK